METIEKEVKSAFYVSENKIIDFYCKAYESRAESLKLHWRWLNRTSFLDNKTPLIVEENHEVIAHSSFIPVDFSLKGKKMLAAWYIDLKVLEEYQRQGLGLTLIDKMLDMVDCSFGFCNQKSLGIALKVGGKLSHKAYKISSFVYLFEHPFFVKNIHESIRKVLSFFSYPIFYLAFKLNANTDENYIIEKLTEKGLDDFYQHYKQNVSNNNSTVIRDENFLKWRIKDSPNFNQYYLYLSTEVKAILHFNSEKMLDVLWMSDNSNKSLIKKMMARLGLFGLKNNIVYVRMLTFDSEIKKHLTRSFFSRTNKLRLVYYSRNKQCFAELDNSDFDFELIDSDFEHV